MSEPYVPIEILLVEDNPNDAELAIRALKKNNLANKLKWVKDGAEALDYLLPEKTNGLTIPAPKVVLLDLRLPKVDGVEVLRRLKADDRTKMIPVVILTSSKEERDVVDTYKIGANSFIPKPVNFEAFVDTVGKLGLYWLVVNKSPAILVPR